MTFSLAFFHTILSQRLRYPGLGFKTDYYWWVLWNCKETPPPPQEKTYTFDDSSLYTIKVLMEYLTIMLLRFTKFLQYKIMWQFLERFLCEFIVVIVFLFFCIKSSFINVTVLCGVNLQCSAWPSFYQITFLKEYNRIYLRIDETTGIFFLVT